MVALNEKLSESGILLRLTEQLHKRLEAQVTGNPRGRQVYIRQALAEKLDRDEAAASGVSPEVARAVAEFKQITGGTDETLVETLAFVAKAKLAASGCTGPVHHRKD